MTLRLDEYWLWDFWLAPRLEPADLFHCFFLQAPRSLRDPQLRHNHARIGHATSPDLVTWTYHGVCFEPGPAGTWDDFTIWTGSVIRADDQWLFFYTGRSKAEEGRVQRIGLATSDDLETWHRAVSKSLFALDPRWYQAADGSGEAQVDCRDPWVVRDADRWLMYFTATSSRAPGESHGVVGLAESTDLKLWSCLPPLSTPTNFGELEVPQLLERNGRAYLLFCTAKHLAVPGTPIPSWNGTHYLTGPSRTGPFELAPEPRLLADEIGTHYAARLVDDPWLGLHLLAWRRWDEHGRFAGELDDPFSVEVTDDNRLIVSS